MTATRTMTFVLAEPERRVLRWLAARVPPGLRPNHFTALGVVAAVGIGVGYALSAFDSSWLWLATAMLVLNWLGDSLDGTLARVRRTERPRYGYYLDHAVDAFNTAVIGVGLGLSPMVSLDLALVLVILYLTLSINVYLESAVFGEFRMAYGRIGPTEVRLLLIAGNVVLVTSPALWLTSLLAQIVNVVLGIVALAMFGMFGLRFGRNLQRLARLEPRHASSM